MRSYFYTILLISIFSIRNPSLAEVVLKLPKQSEADSVRINECLDHELALRIRYDIEICLDDLFGECRRTRSEIRDVEHDPISDAYYLTVDRLDDGEDPKKLSFASKNEALDQAKITAPFSHDFLVHTDNWNFQLKNRANLEYRYKVQVLCKGEYDAFLGEVFNLLTLGLISPVISDSGWQRLD